MAESRADALQPAQHWWRITPERLLVALLAVEGVLLLSERFHWFAFNSRPEVR